MYCDRGNLAEAENVYIQILLNVKEYPRAKDSNGDLHNTRLGVLYWAQDD